MDSSLILSNVLASPVLFFFIGLTAVFLKLDLEIPWPIPKLFSLYLLFAIGFKGGHERYESGLKSDLAMVLIVAVVVAAVVPVYSFFSLRLKFDLYNAAAITATYGSVSAVTFVTASAFLSPVNVDFGGHKVAALALMESPAIMVGLLLVRVFASRREVRGLQDPFYRGEVRRESCLNGAVLTFLLLDMGLVAAHRFKDLLKGRTFLISASMLIPIFNGLLGIAIAAMLGMGQGDALLLAVLCASASYIAVSAAMQLTPSLKPIQS